jgi:hypothetical protein
MYELGRDVSPAHAVSHGSRQIHTGEADSHTVAFIRAMSSELGGDEWGDYTAEWVAAFCCALADLYTPDQFERLVSYRTPDGECLTLTHLHSLIGVHSLVQRDELARLAAEEDWSADELNKRVMELIDLVMEDVDYCLNHATK